MNENSIKHNSENQKVKWGPDNLDGYLNFFSVSGDGRVSNWTLVKTALLCNDALNIEFKKVLHNAGDGDTTEELKGSEPFLILIRIITSWDCVRVTAQLKFRLN